MAAESSLPAVTLVLGGAASGKSRYAEGLVETAPGKHIYIATATAGDAEMSDRIRRHRERRGSDWETVEEPHDLADALRRHAVPNSAVLVDCLTLWLSNRMSVEADIDAELRGLADSLAETKAPVVLVSNEVGQGIVPDNELARAFREQAGRMHQHIAEVAESVILVTAGLPLVLKPGEKV